jgi:hypothetical protein
VYQVRSSSGQEPLAACSACVSSQVGRGIADRAALGHHLGDGAALVVGDAGVGGRRPQEDVGLSLSASADQ